MIPAVLQTGKMNYVYIFDRVTGEALFGMEERPVKRSDDPDDQSWPTQPVPAQAGPIGRVGMTRDDINKMTPEIEKFCTDFWDTNKLQPSSAYARPLRNESIVTFPSTLGGPNWGPLSYNPQLGLVFINLHNTGSYRPAGPLPPGGGGFGVPDAGGGGQRGRGQAPPADEGAPAAPAAWRWRRRQKRAFSYRLPSGPTFLVMRRLTANLLRLMSTKVRSLGCQLSVSMNRFPNWENSEQRPARESWWKHRYGRRAGFHRRDQRPWFRAFDAKTGAANFGLPNFRPEALTPIRIWAKTASNMSLLQLPAAPR